MKIKNGSYHLVEINFDPNWMQTLQLNDLTQVIRVFFHYNVQIFPMLFFLIDLLCVVGAYELNNERAPKFVGKILLPAFMMLIDLYFLDCHLDTSSIR